MRVARAMINDEIEKRFNGKELRKSSEKQIEIGSKFGLDLSGLSWGVAFANIADILENLNYESIEKQDIKPGDRVVNKYEKNEIEYIVSSIGSGGYVYFKKPGSGASARCLIKTNTELLERVLRIIPGEVVESYSCS